MEIEPLNDVEFKVTGNTFDHSSTLKALGGRFELRLSAWVFPKSKLELLRKFIRETPISKQDFVPLENIQGFFVRVNRPEIGQKITISTAQKTLECTVTEITIDENNIVYLAKLEPKNGVFPYTLALKYKGWKIKELKEKHLIRFIG